jgi:hypothetical protein
MKLVGQQQSEKLKIFSTKVICLYCYPVTLITASQHLPRERLAELNERAWGLGFAKQSE